MAALDVRISPEDFEKLSHLSTLLHLFHHRNKNQHRRSIWWRHFSLFRKELARLIQDHEKLADVPTTNLARAKKKLQDPILLQITTKRLTFWQDVMVPKWQHAFSQVIADGRFAVLGLVLMAVLSELCGIVGITAELEELGQVEVERVLEEFGREEWGGEDVGEVIKRKEDVGEVVRRDEEVTTPLVTTPEATSTSKSSNPTKRKSESTLKPIKVKKRKKVTNTNAIDDIFG